MIDVTRRAADQIRSLLKQTRAAEGHMLRLTFDGRKGIGMGLGEPAGDEVVIGDANGPVLAISAQLAPRLDGLVFDWIAAEGQGLGRGGCRSGHDWTRSPTSSRRRARRRISHRTGPAGGSVALVKDAERAKDAKVAKIARAGALRGARPGLAGVEHWRCL